MRARNGASSLPRVRSAAAAVVAAVAAAVSVVVCSGALPISLLPIARKKKAASHAKLVLRAAIGTAVGVG